MSQTTWASLITATIDVDGTPTVVNIEIEPTDPAVANSFNLKDVSASKLAVNDTITQGRHDYLVASISGDIITVTPQGGAPALQTAPVDFETLREEALVSVGYAFSTDFAFDADILGKLAVANQPLSFSVLFERLKQLLDGIDTALNGFDVPFIGESLAELMGIDQRLVPTLNTIKTTLDQLISDTTPTQHDTKYANASALIEMFYHDLLGLGTTSHDGVTFDPAFRLRQGCRWSDGRQGAGC